MSEILEIDAPSAGASSSARCCGRPALRTWPGCWAALGLRARSLSVRLFGSAEGTDRADLLSRGIATLRRLIERSRAPARQRHEVICLPGVGARGGHPPRTAARLLQTNAVLEHGLTGAAPPEHHRGDGERLRGGRHQQLRGLGARDRHGDGGRAGTARLHAGRDDARNGDRGLGWIPAPAAADRARAAEVG